MLDLLAADVYGDDMKEEDRTEIENRIHLEIEKAELDIARLADSEMPVSPDNAIGRLSRMEAMSARSVNQSALNQARARLIGLKHALTNLNDPYFGLCHECEEPIPIKRLLLLPQTRHCVECAEKSC